MTVASMPQTFRSGSLTEFRSLTTSALAGRCGDDVVRLRSMWPALIAATRFARRVEWMFGNRLALLAFVEPGRKRWLTQQAAGDPAQLRFALDRWGSAYARAEAGRREISIFGLDGAPIAALRLDEVDAALDELLWLLVDDDLQRQPAPTAAANRTSRHGRGEEQLRATLRMLERRADFDRIVARSGVTRQRAFHLAGPEVARQLAPGAVQVALWAAFDADLPLTFTLENGGGHVAWSPERPLLSADGSELRLRAGAGRLTISDRTAGAWAVNLARTTSADPTLEAYAGTDRQWLTVALAAPTGAQRIAWRRICAALVAR